MSARAGKPMRSIRGALQKQIIVALLLVLGVSVAGLWLFLRRMLCAGFDDALSAQAHILSAFVEEELAEDIDSDLGEVSLSEFAQGPAAQYFELWLGPERLAARSVSLGKEQSLAPVDVTGDDARFWDLTLPDGRPGRALALRLVVPPARPAPAGEPAEAQAVAPRPPWAHLVVARERGSLDIVLGKVAFALGLLGLALLLVVPLLVTRIARRALQPLDRFADRVAQIDAQTLDGDVAGPQAVPDELRPISAKLNDLMARLRASFDRERRFSADVAHELRTPLAELRAIADVALRFPPEGDARTTAFEDVRDAAIQMDRLLTSLRALAACDGGVQPVSIEPVDVGQLAERAWARFAAPAQVKSLSVRRSAPSGAVVESDPVLLGSVIGNLFSNAIEYAPPGGAVEWSVSVTPGQVTVAVANTNATLRPDDVAHVFEPFWRKDPARTGGLHSGIGLSLAKALADLLGAELTLALEPPDKVRAQLNLPA